MPDEPVPVVPRTGRRWYYAIGPLLIGLVAGAGAAIGAVQYNRSLFLLTPLLVGMGAAWLPQGPRPSFRSCIVAALVTNLVLLLLFPLIGFEGLLCIVMAAPLVIVMGCLGGGLGCMLRRHWERPHIAAHIFILLSLPFLLTWDKPATVDHAPFSVTTDVIVRAAPAVVWKETIGFAPIRRPPTGILSLGIAYPTYAVLHRKGGRIIRECHFSTGAFIEPVTTWDPPYHLAFDVVSQPVPMREISPWHIHPPHLDSMVRALRGEFRIKALADGTTRLRGTTWYAIDAEPAPYWRLWVDLIIHRIHQRVLDHIAYRAEHEGSAILRTR